MQKITGTIGLMVLTSISLREYEDLKLLRGFRDFLKASLEDQYGAMVSLSITDGGFIEFEQPPPECKHTIKGLDRSAMHALREFRNNAISAAA
jgi:hypothetical protein